MPCVTSWDLVAQRSREQQQLPTAWRHNLTDPKSKLETWKLKNKVQVHEIQFCAHYKGNRKHQDRTTTKIAKTGTIAIGATMPTDTEKQKQTHLQEQRQTQTPNNAMHACTDANANSDWKASIFTQPSSIVNVLHDAKNTNT